MLMPLPEILVYLHDNSLCQLYWKPSFTKSKPEKFPPKLLVDCHLTISFVQDLLSKVHLNSADFICISFQVISFI